MATGAAIKAGEAFIELSLRDQRMQRGLRGAMRSLGRIAVAAAKVGVALAGAFGALAALQIRRSIQHFAEFGDQMEKMSQRTGISAQSLSELKFAAEQSGTTIEQLGQAIFRANRRIGNAATGTGPAARALKELRLNAADLARIKPERQFEILVDALTELENPARRSQLAFEIFGDNWRQLAPLINAGAGEIRRLREEAELLGNTITDKQASDAAKLADAINRLRTAAIGFRTQLGATLAPVFTFWLDQMTQFLVDWRQWLNQLVRDAQTALRILREPINDFGRLLGFGDLGTDLNTIRDIFQTAENFRSTFRSAGQAGLSNRVFTGMQQATTTSIGSFRGEAQVFGPLSRNIQDELKKQTELLERLEEQNRNQPIQRF